MLQRLLGLVFGTGAIGTGVYALAAVALRLPPADLVCALEARFSWGPGFDLIEAWAVTWFHLIAALAAPLGGLSLLASARELGERPSLSDRATARARAIARRRLTWGLGVGTSTVTFYAVLAAAPAWLEPISFVARLGLVLGPFGALGAAVLLLDALLPPVARRLTVQRIDEAPEGDGHRVIDGLYTVDADDAANLRAGSEVSIVATRLVATVVEVTALGPYR